jgi:hypothetical protein
MSANRRRHANALPLASMMIWLSVCLFFGAAGLGYVSLKNQLHVNSDQIKKLGDELDGLTSRTRNAQERIKQLSAQTKVEDFWKHDAGRLNGLRKIAPTDRVVFVNRPIQHPVDTEPSALQQAANTRR